MLFRALRYQCIDGTTQWCSKDNGLTRGDVVGCHFFCGFDLNHDGKLSLEESESFVIDCAGPG